MTFDEKQALRIERALIKSRHEVPGPTIGEQLIGDLIDDSLAVIYNMQDQLKLVNEKFEMKRLVCDCGHHLMARVRGSLIEKLYPCIHCKRPMKGA